MRAVRAIVVGSAGVAAATLLCVCLGAAESQPSAAKTPELLQRVATLEEKVAQLERRLDVQPLPAYPLVAPPAITGLPGAQPAQTLPQVPPGLPPHSVPHEFNGGTYYIVPLGVGQAR